MAGYLGGKLSHAQVVAAARTHSDAVTVNMRLIHGDRAQAASYFKRCMTPAILTARPARPSPQEARRTQIAGRNGVGDGPVALQSVGGPA